MCSRENWGKCMIVSQKRDRSKEYSRSSTHGARIESKNEVLHSVLPLVESSELVPVSHLSVGSTCKAKYKQEGWFKAKISMNRRGVFCLDWMGYNDRTEVLPDTLVIPYSIISKGPTTPIHLLIVIPISETSNFSWTEALQSVKPIILNVKDIIKHPSEVKYYLSVNRDEDLRQILELCKTRYNWKLIRDNEPYSMNSGTNEMTKTRLVSPSELEGEAVESIRFSYYVHQNTTYVTINCANASYIVDIDYKGVRDDVLIVDDKRYVRGDMLLGNYEQSVTCKYREKHQYSSMIFDSNFGQIFFTKSRPISFSFRDSGFGRNDTLLNRHTIFKSEWCAVNQDKTPALHLIIVDISKLQMKALTSLQLPDDIMLNILSLTGEVKDIYVLDTISLREANQFEKYIDSCGCTKCVNNRYNILETYDVDIGPYFFEDRQNFRNMYLRNKLHSQSLFSGQSYI